jgi:hypothetical protein
MIENSNLLGSSAISVVELRCQPPAAPTSEPQSCWFADAVGNIIQDVSLICIGTAFDNLSIQEIERGSPDLPIDASYVPDGHKLFRLSTNTTTGYVAAAAFFSSEDDKEYYDDSALVAPEHL